MTFSLTGDCFDHNEAVSAEVERQRSAKCTDFRKTQRWINEDPDMDRRLRDLINELRPNTRRIALMHIFPLLRFVFRDTYRIARLRSDPFDVRLKRFAVGLIDSTAKDISEKHGWRNAYHPAVRSHIAQIVKDVGFNDLGHLLRGSIAARFDQESARRVGLARGALVHVDLGNDEYLVRLGDDRLGEVDSNGNHVVSHLMYTFSPGASTGTTLNVRVEEDLQGLELGTRLYEAMANQNPQIKQWRYAFLKPDGHAMRRHLNNADSQKWPYP